MRALQTIALHVLLGLAVGLVVVLDASAGDELEGAAFHPHDLPEGVTLSFEDNGVLTSRAQQFRLEAPWAPRLQQLRADESLDDVVGEGDEWSRMLQLARWVYGQWAPNRPERTPPWDAIDVLASIRAGGSGFCAQYAIVQVQAALSLGWQARYVGLATREQDNQHVSVEMWSNSFDKWAVLDTHFGMFVEDKAAPGVPLSALEVHAALTGGRRDALVVRTFGDLSAHPRPNADFLSYFFHLAVDQRNDHISGPPNGWSRKESYLGWRDEHTDGRPALFQEVTDQALDFDAPLNQVSVRLHCPVPERREPGLVLCALRTNATALTSIQVTLGDEPPRRLPLHPTEGSGLETSPDALSLRAGGPPFRTLDKEVGQLLVWTWRLQSGPNRVAFQAVNAAGVEGPPAVLEVGYEPPR